MCRGTDIPCLTAEIDHREVVGAKSLRPISFLVDEIEILPPQSGYDWIPQSISNGAVNRASSVVVPEDGFDLLQAGLLVSSRRTSGPEAVIDCSKLLVSDQLSAGHDDIVLALELHDCTISSGRLLPQCLIPLLEPVARLL